MPQKNIYQIVVLLCCIFSLSSCRGDKSDSRLTEISNIVSESPYVALQRLDSINPKTLSSYDKHYYDFLSIKAQDKAYITHQSDSLILDLIKYYSSGNRQNLYSEVLYYGGRVYSDLGDYPTALSYFQKALDFLPENAQNTKLRCQTLSQTGRLLNALRLYEDAIPYIKSAIEIDKDLNDSINEIYDIQLLGTIYLRAHDYQKAEQSFRSALNKSSNLPVSHKAKSLMYIAGVKFRLGQIDSALIYIRDTPNLVKPIARNSALACAAEIYNAAGINDTAFQYANELIKSDDYTNKETGYQIILSPNLRHFISPDTMNIYLSEYLTLLESYFNENRNQLALNQQSFHNYQLHDQKREKAEKSNIILKQWLFSISILVLLMCLIILFLKIRDANSRLELHTALENIERPRLALKRQEDSLEANKYEHAINTTPITKNETTHELREHLRKELYNLYTSNISRISVPQEIFKSEIYQKIQSLISKREELKENSDLWLEIEALVLKCSPNFKTNLQLLVGGKLNSYDLHTSLLIKCGIPPSQMTILLNRSKGAIVSRRESLCYRIFEKKLGTKVIDGIIRLL